MTPSSTFDQRISTLESALRCQRRVTVLLLLVIEGVLIYGTREQNGNNVGYGYLSLSSTFNPAGLAAGGGSSMHYNHVSDEMIVFYFYVRTGR